MSKNTHDDNLPMLCISEDEWRIGFRAGKRMITITPFELRISADGKRQAVPWGELVDMLEDLDDLYAMPFATMTYLTPIVGTVIPDADLGNRVVREA